MSVVYHIFTCARDFRWAVPEDLLTRIDRKKLTPVRLKNTNTQMTCVGVDYRAEGKNPIAVPVDDSLREVLKDPSWLSYSLYKYLTLRDLESQKVIKRPKCAIPAMEIIYDGRTDPAWISSFRTCVNNRARFAETLSGDYHIYQGHRGRSNVFAVHVNANTPNPQNYRFVGTIHNARRVSPVVKAPGEIDRLSTGITNATMRRMMRYVMHRPLHDRMDLFPIFELVVGDMKGPMWMGNIPDKELAQYIPNSSLARDVVA